MPHIVYLPAPGGFASNLVDVTLNWTASTSPSVTTYKAYRSLVTGGPYTLIGTSPVTNSQYIDFAVNRATTYFYVVTAFDGTNESVNSNEASATTFS